MAEKENDDRLSGVPKAVGIPEDWFDEIPTLTAEDVAEWDTSSVGCIATSVAPEDLKPVGEGFPCKYEHVSGAWTICHNDDDLKDAMAYDTKLVVYPIPIVLAVAGVMAYIADYFGYL